jgi:pimeloyl-ACP methyl ester carboxylesterase
MTTLWMETNGGKIAYDDTGSGPLVVCAPGMGDVRGQFRFLAPQLVNAGYRVVTLDLRGHGESSVPWADYSIRAQGQDLVDMIRSLGAGPAILVGNSMSAATAVWAAAEAPELVRGLVLLGPAVHGVPGTMGRLLYQAMFARPWGPSVWMYYFNTLYPTRQPADFEAYKTALRANLQQPGRLEALKAMMLEDKADAEARFGQVQAPVLAIMGSKDPDFKDPAAEAQWVADHLHAKYEVIEGAGHYPHAEMPEITGPIVLSFLRELEPEPEAVYAT